jgi:hypothetical protein
MDVILLPWPGARTFSDAYFDSTDKTSPRLAAGAANGLRLALASPASRTDFTERARCNRRAECSSTLRRTLWPAGRMSNGGIKTSARPMRTAVPIGVCTILRCAAPKHEHRSFVPSTHTAQPEPSTLRPARRGSSMASTARGTPPARRRAAATRSGSRTGSPGSAGKCRSDS